MTFSTLQSAPLFPIHTLRLPCVSLGRCLQSTGAGTDHSITTAFDFGKHAADRRSPGFDPGAAALERAAIQPHWTNDNCDRSG